MPDACYFGYIPGVLYADSAVAYPKKKHGYHLPITVSHLINLVLSALTHI